MTEWGMKRRLRRALNDKRYMHSIGVEKEAVKLARIYGADIKKARIAGLLHDCAKGYKDAGAIEAATKYHLQPDDYQLQSPKLLHAPLGARVAALEYGIKDQEILSAIQFHTTGKENMTLLEKIIYIADMVEEGRNFPGVQNLRELAHRDIDSALIASIRQCVEHVKNKGSVLHPDSLRALLYMEQTSSAATKQEGKN